MNTLVQDLRFACRTLQRSRGFTAVAVLSAALAKMVFPGRSPIGQRVTLPCPLAAGREPIRWWC